MRRRKWDVHNSYHLDGTKHMKSHGRKVDLPIARRQPLTGVFRGTEHLGAFGGHGSRSTCRLGVIFGNDRAHPPSVGLPSTGDRVKDGPVAPLLVGLGTMTGT
jgi:hypothetical protein